MAIIAATNEWLESETTSNNALIGVAAFSLSLSTFRLMCLFTVQSTAHTLEYKHFICISLFLFLFLRLLFKTSVSEQCLGRLQYAPCMDH